MPYVMKPNKLFARDPENSSQFLAQNVVTERLTSEMVAEIQEEGAAQRSSISDRGESVISSVLGAIIRAQSDIDRLEERKDAIADTISSLSSLGTDISLQYRGIPADAKSTGQAISRLEGSIADVDSLVANKLDAEYKHASGDPVVIEDCHEGMALKNVVVHLEPVQEGEGDPSPENVRPISGYSGTVNVYRAGEQISEYTIENGYYSATGEATASDAMRRTSDFIPVDGGKRYVIKMQLSLASTSKLRVHEYDGNQTWLRQVYESDTNLSATTVKTLSWKASADAKYIRFSLPRYSVLELYQDAVVCPIAIPSPNPGTVYDGTIDLANETLTVTHGAVDLGTLTWSKTTASTYTIFYTEISDKALNTNFVCSAYKNAVNIRTNLNDCEMGVYNTNSETSWRRVVIRDDAHAEDTVEQFSTAMSGVQLVYELATPLEYTFAPTEIRTLLGYNAIWSDSGAIDLDYPVSLPDAINEIVEPIEDVLEPLVEDVDELKTAISAYNFSLNTLANTIATGSLNASGKVTIGTTTENLYVFIVDGLSKVIVSEGTLYGFFTTYPAVGVQASDSTRHIQELYASEISLPLGTKYLAVRNPTKPIAVGSDSVQYNVNKNIADISNMSEGYEPLSGTWVAGTANKSGGISAKQSSIAIDSIVEYPRDIEIFVENGYRFCVEYFDENVYTSSSDWVTTSLVMPANQQFMISVTKYPEDLSDHASLAYAKNIRISTNIEYRLSKLESVGEQWHGKKWVGFGTSLTDIDCPLTGGGANEKTGKYPPYLEALSGLDYVNYAVGGSRMCDMANSEKSTVIEQIDLAITENELQDADIVTIDGAVNDWYLQSTIGSITDTTDGANNDTTLYMAMHTAVTKISNANPNAVIAFIADSSGKTTWGYDQIRNGNYQYDFIKAMKSFCEFVGCVFIDAGQKSEINLFHPQYIADHIHHTYIGGEQFANAIWSVLKHIQPNVE